MDQKKNKIGILIESDFYENEIFYYQLRFPEEGYEVHFLSRLWGNPGITFQGHEFRAPFYCSESFEDLTDDELNSYAAFIVPAGMVADRLRYTEDITKLPPACQFLERIFVALLACRSSGARTEDDGAQQFAWRCPQLRRGICR